MKTKNDSDFFNVPSDLRRLIRQRLSLIKKREKAGTLSLAELTDEDLHLAGALHDRRYWGKLFLRYEGQDLIYAYSVLGHSTIAKMDVHDIENIYMICFMKALKNFRAGESKFRTYFHRIFRNDLFNLFRQDYALAHSKDYLSLSYPSASDPDQSCLADVIPGSAVAPDERAYRVQGLEFLMELPPQYDPSTARIIEMRMEGIPVAGIAKRLGYTPYRVRNALEDIKAYIVSEQALDILGLDRPALTNLVTCKGEPKKTKYQRSRGRHRNQTEEK